MAWGACSLMAVTREAIFFRLGTGVSIHSRSAPFCREVTQSSTTRASEVPSLDRGVGTGCYCIVQYSTLYQYQVHLPIPDPYLNL